jgi:hypothetical protein
MSAYKKPLAAARVGPRGVPSAAGPSQSLPRG